MPVASDIATDVLCGVDFSKHSARALRYAATVAQRRGGGLVVVFVNDPLLDAATTVAYDERAVTERSRRELGRFLARALGRMRVARTEQVIVTGDPATEIHRTARQRGCGVIVVGTQGLRGSQHMFFGSTTERLLRVTEVPVLAVPPRAPSWPRPNWPRPRVGCAVDLDEHVEEDARSAAEFAARLGVKLVLIHVLKAASVPPWLPSRRLKHSERLRAAEARLASVSKQLGMEPVPETHVLVGDPAEGMASFAKRSLQLVIVRLRRGKGLLGSRPGTVTYRILSISAVPVLALPAEHDRAASD